MRTLVLVVLLLLPLVDAWRPTAGCRRAASRGMATTCMHVEGQQQPQELEGKKSRRRSPVAPLSRGQQLQNMFVAAIGATTALTLLEIDARPANAAMEPLVLPELVTYDDPQGKFTLKVPKGWFTKRKNPKGPDGEGLMFISGDFNKAITISIESLRLKALIRRGGTMDAPEGLGLTSWTEYGSADGIAGLLAAHKEAMVGAPTKQVYSVLDETIKTKDDAFTFDFETEVRVERPDLLMAEMGVDKLRRRTTSRALLSPGDNTVVIWAAALSRDWDRGYSQLLTDVVNSLELKKEEGGKEEGREEKKA